MSQYATDFSEYTSGSAPTDWTARFDDTSAWSVESDATGEGGKVLQCRPTAALRSLLSWNAIDSDSERADCEIFMRVRFPTTLTTVEMLAAIRATGEESTTSMYRHGPRPSEIAMTLYDNGTYGAVISTTSTSQIGYTLATGVFYNFLIQVRGTSHKLRTWVAGSTEPTTWLFNSTNTTVSGLGWVGLFRLREGPSDVDFFSVGTGTDSASRVPIAQTIPASVTINDSAFEPGKSITGTYANYAIAPTVVTLTDSAGNTITPAVTVNDTAKTFSLTFPPRSASATLLRGPVTLELT